MSTISMTSKMTPRIKEWNYMFLKQTSEMAVKSSINDCLGKENKDRIPHLYKSYLSLLLRNKKKYNLALIRTTNQREDGYKETYNKYKWEEQSIS